MLIEKIRKVSPSRMQKFWFSGIWVSAPLGALVVAAYLYIARTFQDLGIYVFTTDFPIIIILFSSVVLLFFLRNLKRRIIDQQTDFRPSFQRPSVTDLSEDKIKAQNKPVPEKFCSMEPDGLTVGKRNGRYVRIPFMDSPEHQLIYGAPGTKKSNVIKNALLRIFNYESTVSSVLAIDCKPELSRECVYEGRGDIKVINPSATDRYGFDVYFGLSQESTDDDLKERFAMVSRTLIVNSSEENAFFYVSAQNILTAFLMYGFRKGYSFGEAVLTVMDASTEDLISELLNDPEMESHPKIRRLVRAFDGKDSDAFQDIAMTLQQDLSIFDVDTVQRCFASANPKKASPIDLANGISIFIAIPDDQLKLYSPVFRLITQLCLHYMMGLPEWTRREKNPTWFLIDEAGSIGPIPDLLEALARGRSKKIQLSLVCQSYAQLEQTYGRDGAITISDCVKTTVVLSCNNTTTAKSLSDRTGTYRETKVSTHKNVAALMSGASSTNESEEYRPVMDVADITALERDEKVLVFAKGDWFLVDKAPYYTIREHKELSDRIIKENQKFYSDPV